MKVGSYKLVFVQNADSVKEVLVKKSADYAGRPPFYSSVMSTLGLFVCLFVCVLWNVGKTNQSRMTDFCSPSCFWVFYVTKSHISKSLAWIVIICLVQLEMTSAPASG